MKNSLRKITSLMLICSLSVLSAVYMAGCSNGGDTSSQSGSSSSAPATAAKLDIASLSKDAKIYNDTEHEVGYQLDKPKDGEEIAVITTKEGVIKLRFFPEAAEKAVKNFKELAKAGNFNGITFYRAVADFVVQGGINDDTKEGSDSFFGEPFEDEFSNKLFNIRGAVAMANAGKDGNTCEFFINQTKPEKTKKWKDIESNWKLMEDTLQQQFRAGMLDQFISNSATSGLDYSKVKDREDVKKLYEDNGGNMILDGYSNAFDRGHTVFAQVFEGIEIIDKIAAMEIDGTDENAAQEGKLKNPVEITKVEIVKYKK